MVDKSKDPEFWEAIEKWRNVYEKEYEELEKNKLTKIKPIDPQEYYRKCDKPGTMDNTTATIFYIIIMIVGAIFYDRWLIWVVATIIYLAHIFRHEIRK